MILIDGFEIDVTVSEEHSFDSEVTEHPVESGADVADHVRARPIVVTLEGVVSNTPIGALRDRRSSAGSTSPPSDALLKLLLIRDLREPVSITTALQQYDDMLLSSLSVPVGPDDALNFRATFTQVVIVTNERTVVAVKEPRDAKKTTRGTKAAKVITSALTKAGVPPKAAKSLGTFLGDASKKTSDITHLLLGI